MKWKRKKGLVGLCRLMLLLWLLGAVLCGCGMGQGSVPDLCGRDFTADVTWQREGISLRARISVDAGEDLRMEAVFSEPKTMEGLRVVNDGAGVRAELGGMSVSLPEAGELLRAAELLAHCPSLTHLCDTEEEGQRIRVFEGVFLGERLTAWFSLKDGYPLRMEWSGMTVRILSFLPLGGT